ncbi:hypothetical protein MBLNU13_g04213t2 [Cladosporium sp. NU13]
MSTEVQIQGPPPLVGQVGQMASGGQGGIASPISDNSALSRPISPSNVPTDLNVRKRSFSVLSQQQQPPPPPPMQIMHTEHQSPPASAYETSPGGMEDVAHKVQRMVNRENPPQAHDGKYYCNFSPDCADQYFNRKCEWSKHMDKHDRPYRCPQAQCAKLQGFTYSGGLLRHEREVHGKHSGPKEQLRCTVPECKRHAGKGFTRKENLDQHLRRVHGITTTSDASQLRQIAVDSAHGAGMMETLASRISDKANIDDSTTATTACPDLANNKRRRLDMGASPRNSPYNLELELQRLKADNLEKDERIRREENEAAITARRESLEDKLAQFTPQTLQQRIPEQANMGIYPDFDGSASEVVMQQARWPRPRQSVSRPMRSETFSEYDERDQAGTQQSYQRRKRRHSEALSSGTTNSPLSQRLGAHSELFTPFDSYSYGLERSKLAPSDNDDDDKIPGDMAVIDALFERWINDTDILSTTYDWN